MRGKASAIRIAAAIRIESAHSKLTRQIRLQSAVFNSLSLPA